MQLREQDKQLLESMGIDIFSENRQYWLIRTQGGVYYNDFINENFVGIEWDEISDLEMINRRDEETLKSEVLHYYPKTEKPGYPVSQILKFAHNIRKGDIVLIPSENSNWISIGEIQDDNMYIHEEYEEDFARILESLDNDNSTKKPILKKRRKVAWLDSVKKSDLDPYLYSVIYTHSAVANINKYGAFIDRTLSQFYIKGEECYFTYKVNKKQNIPYDDTLDFLNVNRDLMIYINKNIKENFKIDGLILKINVQSKGPIQLKGQINKMLVYGLVISAVFGGSLKFEFLGANVDMSTEGLPALLRSINELVNNNSEELKIIKSKLKNSGEKLYITAPDINLNTDSEVFTNSEISITEEQIDLDSDNSEISIIEEQIDLDSDNNEITQ